MPKYQVTVRRALVYELERIIEAESGRSAWQEAMDDANDIPFDEWSEVGVEDVGSVMEEIVE